AQPALTLQVFAKATRTNGNVACKNRHTVVEDVDVRRLVADVDQHGDAAHRIGIVELEGIVKRKRVDVDHGGRNARISEQPHLRLDQLALRGHEQDVHVLALVLGIENLEV